mmetsp:Transcript_108532/g.345991  ORF Transcript_108532/g.345991 Transcript_108532/m.345991 type:complete len:238 (-) Transcript_108532:18-731(-)
MVRPFGIGLAGPALPRAVKQLDGGGVCQVLVVAADLLQPQRLRTQRAAPDLARQSGLSVRDGPLQRDNLIAAAELGGLLHDELARVGRPPEGAPLTPALHPQSAAVLRHLLLGQLEGGHPGLAAHDAPGRAEVLRGCGTTSYVYWCCWATRPPHTEVIGVPPRHPRPLENFLRVPHGPSPVVVVLLRGGGQHLRRREAAQILHDSSEAAQVAVLHPGSPGGLAGRICGGTRDRTQTA